MTITVSNNLSLQKAPLNESAPGNDVFALVSARDRPANTELGFLNYMYQPPETWGRPKHFVSPNFIGSNSLIIECCWSYFPSLANNISTYLRLWYCGILLCPNAQGGKARLLFPYLVSPHNSFDITQCIWASQLVSQRLKVRLRNELG